MEWIKNLVKRAIYKKAMKDEEFVRLAKKVDENQERMKKKIAEMEAKGEKVPDLYRNLAKGKR